MKKVLFIFCLSLFMLLVVGCASTPVSSDDYVYEVVVDIPGMNASEIYDKANLWAVNTFNSAEAMIEYSNPETYTIAGKFVYEKFIYLGIYQIDQVRNVFTIQIKDEKAKLAYRLGDVRVMVGMNKSWRSPNSSEAEKLGFEEICGMVTDDFIKEILQDSSW